MKQIHEEQLKRDESFRNGAGFGLLVGFVAGMALIVIVDWLRAAVF